MADSIISQPVQLCLCGCGRPTRLARTTSKRDGTIKGRPTKWLKGHHIRVFNPHPPVPIEDRFWKHVNRAVNPDDCWEWAGRLSNDNYGQVQVNGKPLGAHRVAYELATGPIPLGQVIRHTCDNPPCCNPRHLIPGTHKENSADAVKRGRLRCKSPFTQSDVDEMRRLREQERLPIERIAKQFGVSYTAAWKILNYRSWIGGASAGCKKR